MLGSISAETGSLDDMLLFPHLLLLRLVTGRMTLKSLGKICGDCDQQCAAASNYEALDVRGSEGFMPSSLTDGSSSGVRSRRTGIDDSQSLLIPH